MDRIAIVNRTNLKNYGSVLQCYALCEAVRSLGYDAEIIWEEGNISRNYDFRVNKIINTAWKLITHPSLIKSTIETIREVRSKPVDDSKVEKFDEFVDKHIDMKLYDHSSLSQVAKGNTYSKFICGSDQIWCSTTLYVDPLMYLRFAPREKRIAYAPSIGRDYIPDYNRRQMKEYISDIPFVSIREDDGQRLVKELTGRTVPVVLDPTLLISKERWESLAACIAVEKPYILCYFLDEPTSEVQRQIIDLARNEERTIASIGRRMSEVEGSVDVLTPDCGPAEFISYIKEAHEVITDSYHGMLFSIIFEKQFASVERAYQQYDQSSRQITVLNRIGLRDCYVKAGEELRISKFSYKKTNTILKKLREDSLKYLENALRN